jgi:hypothetical protein
MKTTTLLKTLPALGLTLTLSACGGGDDDPGQTGSITACYTANKTVSFAVASSGVPSGSVGPNRSTVGPMTYSGQAVTGQTIFYPIANYQETHYWTVTNSGVTGIAAVDYNGNVTRDGAFLPQNMSPGQTVTTSTNVRYMLIGFEAISLAGKMFSNTCHMKQIDSQGNASEYWYTPGYGIIKQIASGSTIQYNGDL